jgi:hypothetical protein
MQKIGKLDHASKGSGFPFSHGLMILGLNGNALPLLHHGHIKSRHQKISLKSCEIITIYDLCRHQFASILNLDINLQPERLYQPH